MHGDFASVVAEIHSQLIQQLTRLSAILDVCVIIHVHAVERVVSDVCLAHVGFSQTNVAVRLLDNVVLVKRYLTYQLNVCTSNLCTKDISLVCYFNCTPNENKFGLRNIVIQYESNLIASLHTTDS